MPKSTVTNESFEKTYKLLPEKITYKNPYTGKKREYTKIVDGYQDYLTPSSKKKRFVYLVVYIDKHGYSFDQWQKLRSTKSFADSARKTLAYLRSEKLI